MNVALFGGTFDPVHLGHLAVARAARQRFHLDMIYFVPAGTPPHKSQQPITPYHHRYAMLALATQGEKRFIVSGLESPEQAKSAGRANYSIDTVRRFKQVLKPTDRLFFLIGIDAFMEISTWRQPEALLRECEFVVISRPGFSLADIGNALPERLRPPAEVVGAMKKHAALGDIVLQGVTLHVVEGVHENVAATQVRTAAAQGRSLSRYVPAAVEEYIKKERLYRFTAGARCSRLSPEPGVSRPTGHGESSRRLHLVHGGRGARGHAEER
ncbi:MAG: nicotinate-nucleotide adenylyltransferase [Terriglobales bacterium]